MFDIKLFHLQDDNWFHFLVRRRPAEVNFWRPRDKSDLHEMSAN